MQFPLWPIGDSVSIGQSVDCQDELCWPGPAYLWWTSVVCFFVLFCLGPLLLITSTSISLWVITPRPLSSALYTCIGCSLHSCRGSVHSDWCPLELSSAQPIQLLMSVIEWWPNKLPILLLTWVEPIHSDMDAMKQLLSNSFYVEAVTTLNPRGTVAMGEGPLARQELCWR